MTHAIYPGSFNPITLGHVNIIERALNIFDRLTVLIAVNPAKEPLFDVAENENLIRAVTSAWPQVDVDHTKGLLVDYCKGRGIRNAVRGLRAVTDFDVEFSMALTHRNLWTEFDTVYLMTSAEYMYLHSSIVRQVARMGGDVGRFVPQQVQQALEAKFGAALGS